ncbi:GNAT family N-acetyltransferase [Roseibium limicola]|uniref:GNAT family N-acetyltransferase n=1 Tax=Roseibium limicola TaxID=2816037 RepID=A0A939EN13_9HYPH|nr:GNAT family N-acetyltransferase [Roseibium limicola]MBO0345554.1 GNAT family N-acetyltransferase [Roseibium limicola]
MSYDVGQGDALPSLSTQRLVLRPLRKTDAEAVAELGGREFEIARWLSGSSWPYQEGDAESFVDQVLVSDPLRHEAVFAITLGGVTIGCIGVDATGELEELPEYPSLGYWIGKAFQGEGYATEAAEAALAWGFEAHGCEGIGARVYEDNEASINVLEKLGFRPCGSTMRFAEALGQKVNCVVMRLDRKDFDGRCGQQA